MLTTLGTRRARLLALLLVVVALTAGCYGGQGLSSDGPNRDFVNLVNADRAAHGLPGLQWDSQLGGLAQEWSHDMASTGSLRHRNLGEVINRPEYSSYHRLGENIIVGGCGMSAHEMERAWMNSPSHRANILGDYDVVGVGTVCREGRLWATQNFASR